MRISHAPWCGLVMLVFVVYFAAIEELSASMKASMK